LKSKSFEIRVSRIS